MAQAFHAEARAEYVGETRLENEIGWAAALLDDRGTPASSFAASAESSVGRS